MERDPSDFDYKLKQAESFFDVVDTLGGPKADSLIHSEIRKPTFARKHYLGRFAINRNEGQWVSRLSFWPWTYDTHVYLTYDVRDPTRAEGEAEKVAEVQVDGIIKRGGSYAWEQGTHSVVTSETEQGEKLVTPLWYPRPVVDISVSLVPRQLQFHWNDNEQPDYYLPPIPK